MGGLERLLQVLFVLGINMVPLAGVLAGGWSQGTALALYWCENLLGSLLIAARISLHRRLTRKRGHEGGFLAGFLSASLIFTLAHGLFLGAILFFVLPQMGGGRPDASELLRGLVFVVAFQVAAFAHDAFHLRDWPFAAVKDMTDRALGRVFVVHVAIIAGLGVTAWLDGPDGLFYVFVGLKTLLDLAWTGPRRAAPRKAPRWLSSLLDPLVRRQLGAHAPSFDGIYREQIDKEARATARAEEVAEEGS
jgi:hypothetical protein